MPSVLMVTTESARIMPRVFDHLKFQPELRGGAGRNFNALHLAGLHTGNTHLRAFRQSVDVGEFRIKFRVFTENIVAVPDQK